MAQDPCETDPLLACSHWENVFPYTQFDACLFMLVSDHPPTTYHCLCPLSNLLTGTHQKSSLLQAEQTPCFPYGLSAPAPAIAVTSIELAPVHPYLSCTVGTRARCSSVV